MRAYPLLVLLFASGPAAAAVPTGCQEDYSSCKEDCAIEYGGSGRAIKKLTSSADRVAGAKKGSASYGAGRLNCQKLLR